MKGSNTVSLQHVLAVVVIGELILSLVLLLLALDFVDVEKDDWSAVAAVVVLAVALVAVSEAVVLLRSPPVCILSTNSSRILSFRPIGRLSVSDCKRVTDKLFDWLTDWLVACHTKYTDI